MQKYVVIQVVSSCDNPFPYGYYLYLYIVVNDCFSLVVGQYIYVVASCAFGGCGRSVYFAAACFWGAYVVGHLVNAFDSVAVAYHEVGLGIAVVEVVYVFLFGLYAPAQFKVDDCFEPPAKVFPGQAFSRLFMNATSMAYAFSATERSLLLAEYLLTVHIR